MPETILAFDYGLRRIGVAVGQDVTASASPVGVVANGEGGVDHDRIRAIIREWHPTRLVVGMPTHADGSPGAITAAVEAFIGELAQHELPISTIDERYSSLEAEQALKNARRQGSRGRISKQDIDAAAAVFIAERYLAGR
ncbi:MAG: Holliday junction resolvase RuvX [Gammaproteobacteria bacterium]|nr:Holliday junction resolvase RuvX [Gammaproteobacteria bacterium]MDH3756298.1 Holliday junction resolvase RuvX [Gammaproteobacteria bacterium]MDH3846754.1 Holliday junction resolvase RuvX [Gammaproteobacteria bacterium]MDH3863582.1 Holliday junction resolvase RuvX [Gammaproteobacteria bacterium]MDH3904095.1 Holliday junction resolvase RuvX [Gammaproteobacteria bacterium]